MKLLIDLGNTRLKWALWQQAEFVQQGEHQHAGHDLPRVLTNVWQRLPAPQQIVMTSVASRDKTRQLQAWCQTHWQLPGTLVSSEAAAHGIRNAYQQPAALGSDRWVAMIAAFRRIHGAVCVIDCGSAITLDMLNQHGQHLGGYIIPGLSMMLHSLSQGTGSAAITQPDSVGQKPAQARSKVELGTDTVSGMQSGCLLAATAFIEQSVKKLKQQHGDKLHCIISGGDAPTILPLLKGTFEWVPDLVLEGLALIADGGL